MTATMDRLDSAPTPATIFCPTLVLCGRQDLVAPLHLHEALADGIQGAELVVVEDSGYLSSLLKTDAVPAALRQWLRIRV